MPEVLLLLNFLVTNLFFIFSDRVLCKSIELSYSISFSPSKKSQKTLSDFLSILSKQVEHNKWPFLIQNDIVDLSISFRQIRHLKIGDITTNNNITKKNT